MTSRIASLLLPVALVAALVVPSSALAVDAQPEAIDDPPAAFEPEVEDGGIAEIALDPDATTPESAPDEAAVEGSGASNSPSATVATTAVTAANTGALPFTGSDPRQLVLLLLVGSLLVTAGVTALAYARAEGSNS